MTKSGFELYSIGIVAKDLPLNTDIAVIYPIEVLPQANLKDLTDSARTKIKSKSFKDTTFTKTVNKHTINAKWANQGDSNQITPPNVVKGETVFIYKYGDTDIFYWDTGLSKELDLRRLERVIKLYGATSNTRALLNRSNSYTVTISPYDGYIDINTTMANGEFTTYNININGRKGQVSVTDGRTNHIILNSAKDSISLQARENITLRARTIDMFCDIIRVRATLVARLRTYVGRWTRWL